MDFIRVTLVEKLDKQSVSDLKRMEGYLLPIAGIKSISHKKGSLYHIDICDSYMPGGLNFTVAWAEAELSTAFVTILNV